MSVKRPDGYSVQLSYDALGRRTGKHFRGKTTNWLWDGDKRNAARPLHEQAHYTVGSEAGSVEELITWLFEEDSFAPLAKLTPAQSYSVVSDHLGTPLELHDGAGRTVWGAQLDSYGQARQGVGKASDCPFRYQGQYEDQETGLYYNRFRYYSPQEGMFISQDPIGLDGGYELYSYVADTTISIDGYGLSEGHTFPTWMKSKRGYQRHHIVPHSLRNHPIMQRAGMNINSATNMTYLPVAANIDPNKNRSLHRGYNEAHASYNRTMRQQLDGLDAMARQENWNAERMRREILQLQHSTRRGLNNGTIKCF